MMNERVRKNDDTKSPVCPIDSDFIKEEPIDFIGEQERELLDFEFSPTDPSQLKKVQTNIFLFINLIPYCTQICQLGFFCSKLYVKVNHIAC